jgi:hypothetical protein
MNELKIRLLIIVLLFTGFSNAQVPSFLWAKGVGGDGMDNGNSVATDASGNCIVTGYFTSTNIAFGTTTLTNPDILGTAEFFVVKYDAGGNVLWAKSAGGNSNDYGFSVATDASGNIIVTGSFASPTITFGTATLTNAAAGRNDIFIVKYNALGNVLWAKSAGGTEWDEGTSVSTDANGNVLLAGDFSSSLITFGTNTLSTNTAITYDFFLVKYDPSGNVLWAKSEGGSNNDHVAGISADASGNIIVTGWFISSSIALGTTTLNNAGNGDFFLVKYDTGGNTLWAKSAGGSAFDRGTAVSTDTVGNILVTGSFYGPSINFGTTTLTNGATGNLFIVKYSSNGNVIWAKSEGGSANVDVSDVSTDANGNILLTGEFTSPGITFGTTTFTNTGVSDFFILKYNTSGNLLWAKTAGGNVDDKGNSVVTDANGNIFVTGFFTSPTITFGTTTLTKVVGLDFFLLKISDASTTGLEEISFTTLIDVFPNPFSTQITLRTNSSLNNATFKVVNATGKTLAQIENISGQAFTFNRSNLSSGLYFIHLSQGNQLLATKKIIITD